MLNFSTDAKFGGPSALHMTTLSFRLHAPEGIQASRPTVA